MPDTIRTLGELNALLTDNITGNISAQDLRDVLVSMNVHAEIGRGLLSTTIDTSFVKVPMTIVGAFERGFVADVATDAITATPVNLKALVAVEVQITALQAGRTVDFSVFISGVEEVRATRTFDTIGHYSWSLGVQLAQNDTIDLRAIASAASTSINIDMALLRAQRIGIE